MRTRLKLSPMQSSGKNLSHHRTMHPSRSPANDPLRPLRPPEAEPDVRHTGGSTMSDAHFYPTAFPAVTGAVFLSR
ncbi:MAG TPA: hypothetical protein VF708_01480 [Pyrinomonadaceae bacterium]